MSKLSLSQKLYFLLLVVALAFQNEFLAVFLGF